MAGVASQLAASERDKSFFAYDLIADDSGHLRSSVRTEDEAIFDSTRAKIHKNINGMRHMDDDIQLREPVRKEKMSSNILGWPESVEQPPGQVKTPESRILHDLYAPVSQVSASRLVGLTSKQIWTAMVNESENIVHCLLVLISPKRHMALEALINFFDDVWVPESSDNTPLIYELNPTEIFAGNVLHKIVEALFVHNSRFIARTPWIDALADSSFPECLERGRLPDVVDLPKFCPVCNGKIKSTAPGNFRVCSGVSNDHLPLCMEMAILANLTSLVAEGFSPNQEYFDEQHFVCGRFQGDSLPLRESQPQPLEARRHWLAMRIGFTKVVREGHFSRYAALLTAMSVLHNFSHIADVTLYALAIISNETSYTSDFDDKYVMLVPIPFVINSIKFWTDLRKIETRDDSSSSDFVSFDAFHLRTMDDVRRDALGIEGLSVLSEGMSTISMRLCQFKQGENVTYAPDVLQALDELLLNFSCSHLHSARTEFVSSTALRIWAAATVELALHCSNMLICALTTFVCKVNGSDYFLTSPPGDGLRRLNLDLFCIRYFQYLSLLGRSEHIHTLNISYMSKIMMSIAQHVLSAAYLLHW